jgi:hypothetical protein
VGDRRYCREVARVSLRFRRLSAAFAVLGILALVLGLLFVVPGVLWADRSPNGADDPIAEPSSVPPPAQKEAVPAGGQSADAAAATTRYYTTAGAAFIPYTNSLTWTYGGAGCLQPSATGYWRAGITIPDQTVITRIYVGFYNSAPSTASTLYLYAYGYTGTVTEIAHVASIPGSSGTGYRFTAVDVTPPATVNNYIYAYVFAWSGSANQQLCYGQFGYTPPPVFPAALPLVVRP